MVNMPKILRTQPRAEMFPLLGASLLSAAGSLPLHLAPFVTAALIADARTSVVGAGWVWSITLLGEIVIALWLPLLGWQSVGWFPALMTAVALLIALAFALAESPSVFYLAWFAIGVCCSIFKYLGITAASQSSHLSIAFLLRLSIILLLAGTASAALGTTGSARIYGALMLNLGVIFSVTLAFGLLLYRATPNKVLPQELVVPKGDSTTSCYQAAAGLIVVYLFFLGQSGVLVYVLHQATARGMIFEEAALSLAATKVVVGAWLLLAGLCRSNNERRGGFLLQSSLLAIGSIAIYYSRNTIELFAALLCWELTINRLSAALQAAVVGVAPGFAGRWLSACILLGAATGPVINGYVAAIGWDVLYVYLAAVTAFMPAIWVIIARR